MNKKKQLLQPTTTPWTYALFPALSPPPPPPPPDLLLLAA